MSKPVNFVIEHLEEDDAESKNVPAWVELEYRHMLQLAPQDATVHFTSLSSTSSSLLLSTLAEPSANARPQANAEAHTQGILELMKERNIRLERVCLLDPKAEKVIGTDDWEADGKGEFDWFLFGGILGDDPPLDRTSILRKMGFPSRHLGPVQMTTDTALGVTKKVVVDKIPLDKIEYNEFPTISFSKTESVEMPFRYIKADNGEPILPQGMKEHLRKDLDRAFEF